MDRKVSRHNWLYRQTIYHRCQRPRSAVQEDALPSTGIVVRSLLVKGPARHQATDIVKNLTADTADVKLVFLSGNISSDDVAGLRIAEYAVRSPDYSGLRSVEQPFVPGGYEQLQNQHCRCTYATNDARLIQGSGPGRGLLLVDFSTALSSITARRHLCRRIHDAKRSSK